MADLAIGATACLSFWRSLDFKAAAVMVSSIFLLGDAVGHVKQMIVAGNFAARQRRRSLFRRHRLSCARDHSPDDRAAVASRAADFLGSLKTR